MEKKKKPRENVTDSMKKKPLELENKKTYFLVKLLLTLKRE